LVLKEVGVACTAQSNLAISLILPAYNERKRIAETIREAETYFAQRRLSCEVIVSADGDDGTRELVKEMAKTDLTLKVTGNIKRHGKGYGIRHGVLLAGGDIIGFADADNKTPIDEFDKFLPLLRNGYEVVIGSRGLSGSQIERAQPLYRRLGAKGFALALHTVIGLHDIVDTQCGFKFFHRQAAVDLFGRQRIDGYMFDVEILHLARQAGYRIAQVPIRWRDDGDSRLALLRGNLQNVLDLFRIRFRSVRQPALAPAVDRVETKA